MRRRIKSGVASALHRVQLEYRMQMLLEFKPAYSVGDPFTRIAMNWSRKPNARAALHNT